MKIPYSSKYHPHYRQEKDISLFCQYNISPILCIFASNKKLLWK